MDISDIISDSIKYPSSNWAKVLILGIIILAIDSDCTNFFSIWIYV